MSTDADLLESARNALLKAGVGGLSAFDLATAVILDRAHRHVGWHERNAIGFRIGIDLVNAGLRHGHQEEQVRRESPGRLSP